MRVTLAGPVGVVVLLRHRLTAGACLLAATVFLTGCAVVDQYAQRAIAYNLEAEQALDQGLLLNVIRASKRHPMQFTSVQSISGTASASATAAFAVPFIPGAGSSAFGPSISGGPTFTVPVLDTQEFYQGVMKPVQGQLFDFFIHEEYPREELFTLFIEKIAMRRSNCDPTDHSTNCELAFVNYPGSELEFNLTQAMIEHLLNLGITTEQVPPQSTTKSGSTGTTTDQVNGPDYR